MPLNGFLRLRKSHKIKRVTSEKLETEGKTYERHWYSNLQF